MGHDGGDPGVEALVLRWPAEQANLVLLCSVEGVLSAVQQEVVRAWRG